jgi:hypothetical protein
VGICSCFPTGGAIGSKFCIGIATDSPWAKRLEEGTYAMPFGDDHEARREITTQELGALLSGIDLSVAKRRKRYRRKCVEAA